MEYVDGVVPLDELPAGWADDEPDRRRASEALVEVLVRLHAVDPAAVGLADFGRPEGFLARQVRRWGTQWEAARAGDGAGTDADTAAELTRLAAALAADVPSTQRNTIVHGDYRIDNCLYDAADPGTIRAVLDWELSTLGDPLADLGLLLVYWHEADEHPVWRAAQHLPSPTRLPGFLRRAELAAGLRRPLRSRPDPAALVRRVRRVQAGRRAGRHPGPGARRHGAGVDGRGSAGQRRPAGRAGPSRARRGIGRMRMMGIRSSATRPYQRRRRGPVIALVTVLAATALVTWTSVLVNASGPARAGAARPRRPGRRPARCSPSARWTRWRRYPPASVQVRVLNAGGQRGQANLVAAQLGDLGFAEAAPPDNDPFFPDGDMECTGQLRFGPAGEAGGEHGGAGAALRGAGPRRPHRRHRRRRGGHGVR